MSCFGGMYSKGTPMSQCKLLRSVHQGASVFCSEVYIHEPGQKLFVLALMHVWIDSVNVFIDIYIAEELLLPIITDSFLSQLDGDLS